MDKNKARDILPVINDPRMQECLRVIAELEAEGIYRTIITTTDEVQVRMLQGRLQQLERLKSIRERIQEAAK